MSNDDFKPGSFEEYLWTYEVDNLGAEGLATREIRDRLYADWKKSGSGRKSGAAKGVKTREKNAAKGISQKNIKGSTKQKQWAADIRGTMIEHFSPANQKFLMENPIHASFYINYRDIKVAHIDQRLDEVYAKLIEACKACDADRNYVTQKAVDDSRAAWFNLLNGDDEPKNWTTIRVIQPYRRA